MIKAAVLGEAINNKPSINKNYINHLSSARVSSHIVFNDKAEDIVKYCDFLVICGGGDIDPQAYGQQPINSTTHYNKYYDQKEAEYIKTFIKYKKAILGICRGMQSINVTLGGNLIQDIPSILGYNHTKNTEHEIKISKQSTLFKTMGLRAMVNSRHHQCIDRIASDLYVAAQAHDGIIEAIESNTHPILGVQWHPERMSGNDLFEHFLKYYVNKSID